MQQSAKYAIEVIEAVTDRLSGSNDSFVWNKKPSDEFLIGTLNDLPKNSESRIGKTGSSISATGMMFQVSQNDVNSGQIKAKLSGAYYYRVFPGFKELRDLTRDDIVSNNGSERVKLPLTFKKKYFEKELIIDLKSIISDKFSEKSIEFSDFCNDLAKACSSDHRYFIYENRRRSNTFSHEILRDADSYEACIQKLCFLSTYRQI